MSLDHDHQRSTAPIEQTFSEAEKLEIAISLLSLSPLIQILPTIRTIKRFEKLYKLLNSEQTAASLSDHPTQITKTRDLALLHEYISSFDIPDVETILALWNKIKENPQNFPNDIGWFLFNLSSIERILLEMEKAIKVMEKHDRIPMIRANTQMWREKDGMGKQIIDRLKAHGKPVKLAIEIDPYHNLEDSLRNIKKIQEECKQTNINVTIDADLGHYDRLVKQGLTDKKDAVEVLKHIYNQGIAVSIVTLSPGGDHHTGFFDDIQMYINASEVVGAQREKAKNETLEFITPQFLLEFSPREYSEMLNPENQHKLLGLFSRIWVNVSGSYRVRH